MDTTRRLWIGLGALLIVSFGIMLWIGRDIYQTAPPIPEQVVTESGRVVYTREDIETGRQVWQSIGGHHNGSIWGHGALLAPDWSAEWLHRELVAILDMRAREQFGIAYAELDEGEKARLEAQLRPRFRANTYDPATGTITISDERAAAIDTVAAHYMSVFSNDPATGDLRDAYALRENAVPDLEHRGQMSGFSNGPATGGPREADALRETPVPDLEHRRQLTASFFRAPWATATERGDEAGLTYTHNVPHEPLIGNTPCASSFRWSMFSIP